MKRCNFLLVAALLLASCATQRAGTEPHAELKQACDHGSDAACHGYAFFNYDANPEEAELTYRRLCERQLARACSNLAHRLAERSAPDFEQARVFYDRGCELMMADGLGVDRNDDAAVPLLLIGCADRIGESCRYLANFHDTGRGKLPKSNEMKDFYCRKALEYGEQVACR